MNISFWVTWNYKSCLWLQIRCQTPNRVSNVYPFIQFLKCSHQKPLRVERLIGTWIKLFTNTCLTSSASMECLNKSCLETVNLCVFVLQWFPCYWPHCFMVTAPYLLAIKPYTAFLLKRMYLAAARSLTVSQQMAYHWKYCEPLLVRVDLRHWW